MEFADSNSGLAPFPFTACKSLFNAEFLSEIIVDSHRHYLNKQDAFYIIDDYFSHLTPKNADTLYIKAIESKKTLATATKILTHFHKINLKRTDVIIAIGGGLTLDIVAFCASIYKRGCDLWFIPTTIISIIDASIGGKTGINFGGIKNQIGSFYPANKVILDFKFLNTLPISEVRNGFAELIKMMIVSEREFFRQDFDFIRKNLSDYLIKAITYKLQISSKDLFDKGERQFLNLGHTFAHLLEVISDFKISHGNAVAKGIYLAMKLSMDKGLLSESSFRNILCFLKEFCVDIKLSKKERLRLKNEGNIILRSDKKVEKQIKLILINEISVEFAYIENSDELIDFILLNT